jgi:anti-sigma factor ChrR (cupin superfamily)
VIAADLRELMALYVLELLEPADAQHVERACAADPAAAAELASYRATANELLGAPVPSVPSPAVHARLIASIGGGRFERFTARIAKMYDVSVDRARELLGLMERPASWVPALPGLRVIHFEGGPAALHADNGFLQLEPGTAFPWHSHRGRELVIVLSGALRDHNGRVQAAGDEYVMEPGSAHDFVAIGDEPCIYAACVIDGLEIKPRP